MCLAIPSRITEINDQMAIIDADGTYSPDSLVKLLEHWGDNDMVVGARLGPAAGHAHHHTDAVALVVDAAPRRQQAAASARRRR